jgi:hypothetical protein
MPLRGIPGYSDDDLRTGANGPGVWRDLRAVDPNRGPVVP